jgi:hypothetical protein
LAFSHQPFTGFITPDPALNLTLHLCQTGHDLEEPFRVNVADPVHESLSDAAEAATLDTDEITDLELLLHEPWSPTHVILS